MYTETTMKYRKDFKAKHGAHVQVDGWLIFSDGAQCEWELMGAYIEPSKDLFERWKVIALYRETVLQRAIAAFEQYRAQLDSQARGALRDGIGGVSQRKLSELRALQKQVRDRQRQLKEARDKIEEFKPDRLKRNERMSAETRAEAHARLNELRTIKV